MCFVFFELLSAFVLLYSTCTALAARESAFSSAACIRALRKRSCRSAASSCFAWTSMRLSTLSASPAMCSTAPRRAPLASASVTLGMPCPCIGLCLAATSYSSSLAFSIRAGARLRRFLVTSRWSSSYDGGMPSILAGLSLQRGSERLFLSRLSSLCQTTVAVCLFTPAAPLPLVRILLLLGKYLLPPSTTR